MSRIELRVSITGRVANTVRVTPLSAGRAPSPAVAFDDSLLPIDINWFYFEKLALVP